MSGAVAALMLAARGFFAPVVRTYDTGAAVSETIPSGANQVTIEVWGGGGNGGTMGAGSFPGGGAASGSYSSKTVLFMPTDWGKTFVYTVGAATGTSAVTNGTFATALSLTCLPGGNGGGGTAGDGGTGGVGQAATGGTVNTSGVVGVDGNSTSQGAGAPNGGAFSSVAGTPPGGGGAGRTGTPGAGFSGAAGRVRYSYS